MTLPSFIYVIPFMGKVQYIFSLIMTRILHSYILQALGMKEKGIYKVLKDYMSNFDFDVLSNLNTL